MKFLIAVALALIILLFGCTQVSNSPPKEIIPVEKTVSIEKIQVPPPIIVSEPKPQVTLSPIYCGVTNTCSKITNMTLRDICYNNSAFEKIYDWGVKEPRLVSDNLNSGCCLYIEDYAMRRDCVKRVLNNEKTTFFLVYNLNNGKNFCSYVNVYVNELYTECLTLEEKIAKIGNGNCEFLSTDVFFQECVLAKKSCNNIQNATLRDMCFYYLTN